MSKLTGERDTALDRAEAAETLVKQLKLDFARVEQENMTLNVKVARLETEVEAGAHEVAALKKQ